MYAAADVEYLLALHDVLVERLEPMGRLEWATRRMRGAARCACARGPNPKLAWWRIKGARQLRGDRAASRSRSRAWRERAAEALDVPPRYVLSDLALVGDRAPPAAYDVKS